MDTSFSQKYAQKSTSRTRSYVSAIPANESAATVKQFLHKLKRLQRAILDIRSLLWGDELDEATADARRRFEKMGTTKVPAVATLLPAFKEALRRVSELGLTVEQELSSEDYEGGFEEGMTWEYWICWLTYAVRDHGLPATVRKDSATSRRVTRINLASSHW